MTTSPESPNSRSRSASVSRPAKRKCNDDSLNALNSGQVVPIKDFLELKATCDRMAKQIEDLVKIVAALAPAANLPTAPSSRFTQNVASHQSPAQSSLDLVKEAAQMLKKSKRAVIELLPDSPDDPEQDNKDMATILKLASKHNLTAPTSVFRHKCKSKLRPLKLEFNSTADRDSFIKGFNRFVRPSEFSSIARKPRCRRDLTLSELTVLRCSRETIYKANKEAGMTVLFLNDIYVKKNMSPRPFH
uniref:Uncharacterized protein n=1 Tax=Caenorhabditis japonica TaxID=281687 RepID=A0A8R1HWL3_CAEJA